MGLNFCWENVQVFRLSARSQDNPLHNQSDRFALKAVRTACRSVILHIDASSLRDVSNTNMGTVQTSEAVVT